MLHNPSLAIIAALFFLHSLRLWFRRTCVALLSGGFCASSERCQKGVSLARCRAIKRTHTHTSRATLEVNVTEGAPTAPGNRFLSHFVSLLSPFTLLKRPRSKALWEVARRPVGRGGGYRGLMRWRIPTWCLHRQILIKNSSVSSFVSSSALWPFFYLFHSSRKSSLPWSDTSFTFVLAVKVETVQCGLDAAHPESGGGRNTDIFSRAEICCLIGC